MLCKKTIQDATETVKRSISSALAVAVVAALLAVAALLVAVAK